jgi:hypothetical protein
LRIAANIKMAKGVAKVIAAAIGVAAMSSALPLLMSPCSPISIQ